MTYLRKLLCMSAAAGVMAVSGAATAANQCGEASWYQMGHTTANGESYNPDGLTAAHRNLPFGTEVRVHNLGNGRSVNVRINDRGPFVSGRIIDVSRGAARQLGLVATGTARVRVTALDGSITPRGCGPGDRVASNTSSPSFSADTSGTSGASGGKWALNAFSGE